jgi:hypothetical protein
MFEVVKRLAYKPRKCRLGTWLTICVRVCADATFRRLLLSLEILRAVSRNGDGGPPGVVLMTAVRPLPFPLSLNAMQRVRPSEARPCCSPAFLPQS